MTSTFRIQIRTLCILIAAVLFITSCAKTPPHNNNAPVDFPPPDAQAETEVDKTIRAPYEAQCSRAYSADTVFISDPVFALAFMGNNHRDFSSFYTAALRAGMLYAHMFITAESAAVSTAFSFPVNNISEEFSKLFTPLSSAHFTTAMRAKRVVFSPLAHIFAPKQLHNLEEYRKRCGLSVPVILNTSSVLQLENDVLSINYAPAVQTLGRLIADRMIKANTRRLIIALRQPNAQNTANARLIASTIYNIIPDAIVRFVWNTTLKTFQESIQAAVGALTQNDFILLDTAKSNTSISQTLFQNNNIKRDHIFAIMGPAPFLYKAQYSSSYGIYASAWVAIPLSSLFENNYYGNAHLYRTIQ